MGNMHGHSDSYPKWDLMIFTEDRLPEILGIVTDLEQFLDHYGLDAKPSRLKPNQQLVVIKNGLYESLTSNNEFDRDLWVRGSFFSWRLFQCVSYLERFEL